MATFTIDLLTGNPYLFNGDFSGSGSTPTSGSTYPKVGDYSALPSAGTVAGQIYVAQAPYGTDASNRKPAGLYYSTSTAWRYLGETPSDLFKSNFLKIVDSLDASKGATFVTSGISTSSFRKLILQNSDGTIAYLSDVATKLDKSAFDTYTGTTAPDVYISRSQFNSFTGSSQPILDLTITGATNIGTGEAIYDSNDGRNLLLKKLVGSGDTTITQIGNDLVIKTTAVGAVSWGQIAGNLPDQSDLNSYLTGLTATKANKSSIAIYTGTTAPNTFVGKVAMNTYSGTTAPNTFAGKAAINTYTGATAPATFVGKTAMNVYSGTTVPNTYFNKTQISTYTGATKTAIDSKAIQASVATYTGTTAPNTFVGKTAMNTYSGTTVPNTYVGKVAMNIYSGTTVPNTYFNKTQISTYTGVTAPYTFTGKAVINTYTGTTAPNTFTGKVAMNIYSGTTAPATFVGKSAFNTYSGTTAPNTFVSKIPFSTYSANTLTNINSRVLKAGDTMTGSLIINTNLTVGGITRLSGATYLTTLGTGSISADRTLFWNPTTKALNAFKLSGGSDNYHYAENTTPVQNATATFVHYLGYTGTTFTAGRYSVDFQINLSNSNAGRAGSVRFFIDGVQVDGTLTAYSYQANSVGSQKLTRDITFGAGTHTFLIDFNALSNTATASYGVIRVKKIY